MTDAAYRGQGLNRKIMTQVLQEYSEKSDGIYLFGNDTVLDYYPKFGFKPCKEHEYYVPCTHKENIKPYPLQKVDMTQKEQYGQIYEMIQKYSCQTDIRNQNDGMCMYDNLGLFQFWLDSEYKNHVYFLPETGAYIVAELECNALHIYQIFGKQKVDVLRLAASFENDVNEIVLGYTPMYKENYLMREHKEEDCTLFILGKDLERIEREKMMFPVLSHA